MCMQNIFNGVIWFVLPVLLVAANDTFAYIWGFFIGKKYIQIPLISLSVSDKVLVSNRFSLLFSAQEKLGRIHWRWDINFNMGIYICCIPCPIPVAHLSRSIGC